MGDKSTVITYYVKTLEVYQKSFPYNHRSVVLIHLNISRALDDLHRYQQDVGRALQTLNIFRRAFASDRVEVKLNEDDLDRLQQKL